MKKIGVVGGATQDIFMLYEGADTLHLHLQKQERSYLIFEQGTKIDIPQLHYATGGGATNAGVSFKRLGLEVELFFKRGTDVAGQFVHNEMLKEEVGIEHAIIDSNASTAISFIVPSLEHNHVALCFRGANTKLSQDEFPLAFLHDVGHLYIGPLSGSSGALLPFLATAAKERGITVAANPSMSQIMHDSALLQSALATIDILIANAYEAAHIVKGVLNKFQAKVEMKKRESNDKPVLLTHFVSLNGSELTLFDYCRTLLQQGPSIVVVTNGIEGVYVATKEVLFFHPSIKADVMFALGAGDAFSGAFVGSLALGKTIETAITYGVINAHSVIQQRDAKEGLLTVTELEHRAQLMGVDKLQRFSMK